ncbi:3TM-type holin [uncultured Sphingomonas sp.]|uniref:3TM-type holin n=1 Tax=uncultured Sphingomonas sp. TaxID=158754 RepID=UPI0035CA9849
MTNDAIAPVSDEAPAPSAVQPGAPDRWTRRARPTFLYVMYALLLWAIPTGLVAAVSPATARAMATGMALYFNAMPEPLYTLFGTGYLGYTLARQWGKASGSER